MQANDNFEKFLRNKTEEFELPYSEEYWKKAGDLLSDETVFRKKLFRKRMRRWFSVAASSLLVTGISVYFYFSTGAEVKKNENGKDDTDVSAVYSQEDETREKNLRESDKTVFSLKKKESIQSPGEEQPVFAPEENLPEPEKTIITEPAAVVMPVRHAETSLVKKHTAKVFSPSDSRTQEASPVVHPGIQPGSSNSPDIKSLNSDVAVADNPVSAVPGTKDSAGRAAPEISQTQIRNKPGLQDSVPVEKTTASQKAEESQFLPEPSAIRQPVPPESPVAGVFAGISLYSPFMGNAPSEPAFVHANPFLGITVEKNFGSRISLSAAGIFTIRGKINYSASSDRIVYGFGRTVETYRVVTDKIYFVELPFSAGCRLGKRHRVSAGGGISYLLNTASYVTDYGQPVPSVKKEKGYTDGFSSVNFFLTGSYQFFITNRFRLSAGYQAGIGDITDDDYFRHSENNKNNFLRLGLTVMMNKRALQ